MATAILFLVSLRVVVVFFVFILGQRIMLLVLATLPTHIEAIEKNVAIICHIFFRTIENTILPRLSNLPPKRKPRAGNITQRTTAAHQNTHPLLRSYKKYLNFPS